MTPRATSHPTRHRRPIAIACLALLVSWLVSCVLGQTGSVEAATVIASYEHGREGVIINGYGTRAMGSFRLRDGERSLLAWCLEADVAHSTQSDAYREVSPVTRSAELDALLWWLDQQPTVDADTAVAAASLTWYYAAAHRSNGPLVWSDGSRAFAPISPISPERWDALPSFSLSDPVGLIASGTHLDGAEGRVLELHHLAGALAGPWELTIAPAEDRASATVALRSPAGPRAGHAVEITIEVPGAAPLGRSVTTGDDGRAQISLPDLSGGAVIRAAVSAPGPHQEWDGDGAVQRLATSTSMPIRAVVTLPPLPGHVEVRKRSSDPTIDVAGGVFVLVDGNGDEVGTATSTADGVARFAPIDSVRNPPPYRVSERAAPPGLLVSDAVVDVAAASHDPTRPTVVEITNAPMTIPLELTKRLSIDDAGPDDLGGFRFEIRRRVDGAVQEPATAADGAAPPVRLPLGTYDVCEVDVPDWAAGLIDTGCRTVTVDAAALAGDEIRVDYVNEIPPPTVDTHLTDPTDGDQLLDAETPTATVDVVDRVSLSGLIPGVRYTIDGELVRPDHADPVVATTRVELVAEASTATVAIVFAIDDLAAGRVVATERISVGGVVLAEHRDLNDPDQTVTVIPPPTTTTTTATTTTATTTTTAPVPDSTTTTTTTTATTTAAPAVGPPVTTAGVPTPIPPSTLPRTGGDSAAGLLRLGDVGFVLGVALVAIAGLVPRRSGRDEAGC